MSPSSITPLVSSQINHDQLKVELVEPDTMPAMVRIVCRHSRPWSTPSASPTWLRRLRSCLHGRTLCSPA